MDRLIRTGQARRRLEELEETIIHEKKERRLWEAFLSAKTEKAYRAWAEEAEHGSQPG